nr:crooked neck-like protein 1 [Tanacetum cinerariifolium]
MWLLAAQLETKQSNLSGARAILGKAIGLAPKYKIFKKYIAMALRLVNIDCCRKLYKNILSAHLKVAMHGASTTTRRHPSGAEATLFPKGQKGI